MPKLKPIALITALLCVPLTACTDTAPHTSTPDVQIAIAEDVFAALASEDADLALSMLNPSATLCAPYNPNGDATDAGIRSFPAALYVKGAIGTYDSLVFDNRVDSLADSGETGLPCVPSGKIPKVVRNKWNKE